MSAAVSASAKGLQMGTPQELFQLAAPGRFDLAPDGQRILILRRVEGDAQLMMVTNWYGLLER